MTERDAFIQAICQDPQNDTIRLIFADWLDERGDPLGEFIRVQIRLHHEGKYVGKGAVHDNQLPCERIYNREDPTTAELWQRSYELVNSHDVEWTKDLFETTDGLYRRFFLTLLGWTRGFPSSINISVREWNAKADELLLKYPLEKVTLNHRGGRQRPERREIPQTTSLFAEWEMRLPGRAWVRILKHERVNDPKWLYEYYWPGIKFVL